MTKQKNTPIEGEILPPTADQYIEQAVKSYNVTDAAIGKLREAYANLTIKDTSDKEGYEQVRAAIADVRSLRTGIEAKRKELIEFPLKFQREVNAEAKRITAELEAIEGPLKDKKAYIDNEAERLRKEAEERKRAIYMERTNALFNMGCTFNGSFYALDGSRYGLDVLHVTPAEVEALEEHQWNAGYGAMLALSEKIKFAEEAEAAEKAAEAERLAAIEAENAALRERLAKLEQAEAAKAEKTVPVTDVKVDQTTGQVGFDIPAVERKAPVYEAPAAELPTPSFNPTSDYGKGFVACQTKVLERLDAPDKFTRAELKEFVRRLRP
jgi:DNA repair exonuclease SbcCD ATPase subunit